MKGKKEYKPEYAEKLVELMDQGWSVVECCREFGIGKSAFYGNWVKNNPDLAEALELGKTFSEAHWIRMAVDNIKDKDFNYKIWHSNMKNRFDWRDTQDHKVMGHDGGPVQGKWTVEVVRANGNDDSNS